MKINPMYLHDSKFEQSKRSCRTSEHAKLVSWAMFEKETYTHTLTHSKIKLPEEL